MTKAVFPGTFDPITRGHESLVRRAAAVFDEIIVGVAAGLHKASLFTLEERLHLVQTVFAQEDRIRAVPFDTLLADFMHQQQCKVVIRGVRVVSDFEFEAQLADINKALDSTLETVFFLPDKDFIYLSSTIVREIAQLGGDIEKFVSPVAAAALRQKLNL